MSLSADKTLLAVARENKAIEVYKTDSFAQILRIPGHKNVDIRSIHWLEPGYSREGVRPKNHLYYSREKNGKQVEKKRRLVTTGLNGMVIEWDLGQQKPLSRLNCQCGIWQSVMVGKFMYVACEDGSIRVI